MWHPPTKMWQCRVCWGQGKVQHLPWRKCVSPAPSNNPVDWGGGAEAQEKFQGSAHPPHLQSAFPS